MAVTVRYVMLTGHLAAVARDQLDQIREAGLAELREVQSRLAAITTVIADLPDDLSRAERIRTVPFDASALDLGRLHMIAARLGSNEAGYAAELASSLQSLDELAKEVKRTPRMVGTDWSAFPWDRWSASLESIQKATSLLSEAVDQKLNPGSSAGRGE